MTVTAESIKGVVRHALTTAGGALAAAGLMSSDQAQGCVADLLDGLNAKVADGGGLAMVTVAIGWSIYQKMTAPSAPPSAGSGK